MIPSFSSRFLLPPQEDEEGYNDGEVDDEEDEEEPGTEPIPDPIPEPIPLFLRIFLASRATPPPCKAGMLPGITGIVCVFQRRSGARRGNESRRMRATRTTEPPLPGKFPLVI